MSHISGTTWPLADRKAGDGSYFVPEDTRDSEDDINEDNDDHEDHDDHEDDEEEEIHVT